MLCLVVLGLAAIEGHSIGEGPLPPVRLLVSRSVSGLLPATGLATVSHRLRQFVNEWPFNNARHARLSKRLSSQSGSRWILRESLCKVATAWSLVWSRFFFFLLFFCVTSRTRSGRHSATSVTRSKRHAFLPFTDNGQGRSFQFLFARLFTRSETTATKYVVDTTMFRSWCRRNG